MKIFYWQEIYNLFSCSSDQIKYSTEGFFFNNVREIVGLVKAFDKEYIYMVVDPSVQKYIEFENPVIGIIEPPPAITPIRSYTPSPVRILAIIIRIINIQLVAFSILIPGNANNSKSNKIYLSSKCFI